jgi:hypothetical protein
VASEPSGATGTAPAPPRDPAGRRTEVLTVYAVGLFQGLSLVAVPAADTSFFPSIGAVNPALTAMANALRVGAHLTERLG